LQNEIRLPEPGTEKRWTTYANMNLYT